MSKQIKPEEGVANPWQGDQPEKTPKVKAKRNPKKNQNKEKPVRADEPLHKADAKPEDTKVKDTKPEPEPEVKEFTIKKGLNPYGFMHVPKKARSSLPFEQGVPLKAKIKGDALVIRAQ